MAALAESKMVCHGHNFSLQLRFLLQQRVELSFQLLKGLNRRRPAS